jgi:Cys-tRNA(Pro)/Cys-tRNA(Cys) deacylase
MTPAIRALEAGGVAFTLHRYEYDADADSFGEEAAAELGVSPERVFKTLVAAVDGPNLIMAIIPASARLDMKKLAAARKGKKADLAEPKAAERATGYVVGGISPLGGRKKLPVLLDATAFGFDTIYVSAGQRGLQIELAPADLKRAADATMVDLVKPNP